MPSPHARRYAARAAQAARGADARAELSDAAYACLISPADTMPAGVFRELLEKGFLQSARRGWTWTQKAEAARAKA